MESLVYAEPASLGIDPEKFKEAEAVLKEEIEKGSAPGAVALVLYQNKIAYHYAFGKKALVPEPEEITLDTIYDLASITKCVATTTACMMLMEQGLIGLEDPIAKFFPDFAGKEEITIFHLLTHTSGLPAWLPLYQEARSKEDYRKALAESDLEHQPGAKVVYSCLGFILLGLILEKVAGEELDAFLQKALFDPLGMEDTCFNPKKNFGPEKLLRVAPTEATEDRGLLRGEVHDENAYCIGGVSGNAGLFSTAVDLAKFASMLLSGGVFQGRKILEQKTIELMTQNHTAPVTPNRGLGWLKKNPISSGGSLLTDASYGHTGFTGTSMWLDPVLNVAIILLTNQVHPSRHQGGVAKLRSSFADAVVSALPKR